ncbi:RlmE family RNA methyltransferase [Methanofollis aquaemaris]|uniref:Ribosomal RNA large subunit methyltransferase E n=1 Tax=Methanofollis aquaemaris TaxID=126734 RepID=A0A8A3S270_9EURY|nr:RlmE family RNA methyltransferase [Methanofollis aquaemaris]QSZ66447.1 RlmE family RNA methyltransferase [Methanofollis aquaemaris]
MTSQWTRDRYYKKAMKEGFRARAAYKLTEIQKRFSMIREDDNVVDLGAAPGSWLQVLQGLTHGRIIGVDLNSIAPMEGVTTVVGDFTTPEVQEEIRTLAEGTVSVVTCDASPKLSGATSYDQARAIALGEDALTFAVTLLKEGGNFVCKTFQGEDFPEFYAEVKKHFHSVRTYRPPASRRGSREVYIIAKNFRRSGDGA